MIVLAGGVLQAVPAAMADSVGEIVVQPANGKTITDVNQKFKQYGTTTVLTMEDTTQAMVRTNTVQAALAAMKADAASGSPTVSWAEQNIKANDPRAQEDGGADPYCPPPPPDVPTQATSQEDGGADGQHCTRIVPISGLLRSGTQYAFDRMKVYQAQSAAKDGRGLLGQLLNQDKPQVVAVLDTQVDVIHPELLLRSVGGLDLLSKSLLTTLPTNGHAHGHGTFVAGVVAKTAPNAKIMPVAVLNDDGIGSTVQVAAGIRWAVKHGADVINMSLHTPTDTQVLKTAVADAIKAGVVVVAAYGNEGKNLPTAYPADYSGVISVMATDQNDTRATFSNYGRPGVVAAPGVNIISTYPLGLYAIGSGTSFAAPWVAGEAALMLQANPSLTPRQVLDVIQQTSDDVSAANRGAKTLRVNQYRAVSAVD